MAAYTLKQKLLRKTLVVRCLVKFTPALPCAMVTKGGRDSWTNSQHLFSYQGHHLPAGPLNTLYVQPHSAASMTALSSLPRLTGMLFIDSNRPFQNLKNPSQCPSASLVHHRPWKLSEMGYCMHICINMYIPKYTLFSSYVLIIQNLISAFCITIDIWSSTETSQFTKGHTFKENWSSKE